MMSLKSLSKRKQGHISTKSVLNPSSGGSGALSARHRPNSSVIGVHGPKGKQGGALFGSMAYQVGGGRGQSQERGPKIQRSTNKKELAEFKAREGFEFLPHEFKPVQRDEFKER